VSSPLPYYDIATAGPVFAPGVNVFTPPIRFEAYTDGAGPRSGMGNYDWNEVDNPLYDPNDPLFDGLTAKDFPGFVVDIQMPFGRSMSTQSANESPQFGMLFAPRNYSTIVQADWRFNWQGVFYHITGAPAYDVDHPLTGENFGYVQFMARKGG
jgi:hypothetical protein